MSALLYFSGLLVAVLVAATGELVSDEIRARLDRIPLALLAIAASRLPRDQRDELYEQAWFPELHHILQGNEATPITRLVRGTHFALGLWLSAPQIRRELQSDGPALAATPTTWASLFPEGRHIFYEGHAPARFREEIRAEFGFDPSADPRWGDLIPRNEELDAFISYSFHCPPEHLDAINAGGRFPMGS
jgi:hypothetical protein